MELKDDFFDIIITPCETCPIKCTTDSWHRRSCKTLVENSVQSNSFYGLKSQWIFNGELCDYGEDMYGELIRPEQWPDCQLCGHEKIRYGYTITNKHNGRQLVIGSKCVTRFGAATESEIGKLEREYKTRKNVKKTIQFLQKMENEKSIPEGFLKYYNENGAFTPKQCKTVIDILKRKCVDFDESILKVKIRRGREKNQLLEYGDFIINCLNPSQKQVYLRLTSEQTGE